MPKNNKTIEQKYQKKTQKEHILDRPDSYIGDVKKQNETLWTFNPESEKMHKKNVEYVPGLLKILMKFLLKLVIIPKKMNYVIQLKYLLLKKKMKSVYGIMDVVLMLKHIKNTMFLFQK